MQRTPLRFLNYVIVNCLFAFIFLSCSSTSNIDNTTNNYGSDSLTIYLERGICFGKCPVYSISIYNSGYVIYEGKLNVDKIGVFSTFIDIESINKIINRANEINYWELEKEYRNPYLTDLPTIKTALSYGKKHHSVIRFTDNPPQDLVKLEKYIDSFFEADINWKKLFLEKTGSDQD